MSSKSESRIGNVRWQVMAGWSRCGVWIDNRGIVIDVGGSRYQWWRPRLGDRCLHSIRQIPERWYGRMARRSNPRTDREGFTVRLFVCGRTYQVPPEAPCV